MLLLYAFGGAEDSSEYEMGWTPVLAHPLSQRFRPTEIGNDANGAYSPTEEHKSESAKIPESAEEDSLTSTVAFDPLGVCDSLATNGELKASNGHSKGSGKSPHSKPDKWYSGGIDELATGCLSNSLNDRQLAGGNKRALPKEETVDGAVKSNVDNDPQLPGFRPWSELRQKVLATFTTTESLSMESSFLEMPGAAKSARNKAAAGEDHLHTNIPNPKNRSRTDRAHGAQLSKASFGANKESSRPITLFKDLSQQEYVCKVEDLRRVLLFKWGQERRLECVQLVVEAARLLSSVNATMSSASSSPQFYPAQFVHLTEQLLEPFGQLVYKRLRAKADWERSEAGLPPLPQRFDIPDVLEKARITARNWFGKVAEIREPVARVYVEASLLCCMVFMDQAAAIPANLLRLCNIIKTSIHHPIVAAYARCYLCRMALRLDPQDRSVSWRCLNDWMQSMPNGSGANNQQAASILWPALEWVVQCVAVNAVSYEDLSPLWEYCRLAERRPLILCPTLNSLPTPYLAEHAVEACRIVTSSDEVGSEEICVLGRNLLKAGAAESMGASARKSVLRAVWKCIQRMQSTRSFMHCAEVWVEFVARHFTINELQVVAGAVLRRLQGEKVIDPFLPHLHSMLSGMLVGVRDTASLLRMELFPQLVDMFHAASDRESSSRCILTSFTRQHASGEFTAIISHLGLAQLVLDVAKRLSDSMEVSAPEEELESNSLLIESALDRFHFDRASPEQSLDFYVVCRGALLNNDRLQRYTILRIYNLALYVVQSARYSSARSGFLQICLANLFITIPSLVNPLHRVLLAIQSSHLALLSMAYLQLHAFLDYILDTITEFHKYEDMEVAGRQLLSLLSAFPTIQPNKSASNCEEDEKISGLDPVKLCQRFFSVAFGRLAWPASHSHASRLSLLLNCLQFLLTYTSVWPMCSPCEAENDETPQFDDRVSALLIEISSVLAPSFPEKTPTASLECQMHFLEIIALYSPMSSNQQGAASGLSEGGASYELPDELKRLARQVYKQCKKQVLNGNNSAMERRLTLLK